MRAQAWLQPAVITLNSTVASLAGTMFLSMVAGLDAPARYLVYDGNRQRVAQVEVDALSNCNFCGPDSTIGAGDRAPLPTARAMTRATAVTPRGAAERQPDAARLLAKAGDVALVERGPVTLDGHPVPRRLR